MRTKRRMAWTVVGCVALATAVGCGQEARVSTGAPAGWEVVYAADFRQVRTLPDCWVALRGEASVADGALVLKAGEGEEAEMILKAPACPGSVRLEAVGCLVAPRDEVCDFSPILNADESGYKSGYLLQFGGADNTLNRLRRSEDIVEGTVNTRMRVTPNKKHVVVAENDGGRIRLVVDGTEVLTYTDAEPLKGKFNGLVGFYTWGTTLKIDRITVWAKP